MGNDGFIFVIIHQPPPRRCGDAAEAEVRGRLRSQQRPVRHHVRQRRDPLLPQILLRLPQIPPILLLHRVLGELNSFPVARSAACRGSLCGHVFMGWRLDVGFFFPTETKCSAPANRCWEQPVHGEWRGVLPLQPLLDQRRGSDRWCHLWRSEEGDHTLKKCPVNGFFMYAFQKFPIFRMLPLWLTALHRGWLFPHHVAFITGCRRGGIHATLKNQRLVAS